jgi:DNA-directed RNA polymerase subunit M/transcription elongation factor TFIIS
MEGEYPIVVGSTDNGRKLTVIYARPRCYQCDSTRLSAKDGSRQQGDGSVLRFTTCLDCGKKFNLVLE